MTDHEVGAQRQHEVGAQRQHEVGAQRQHEVGAQRHDELLARIVEQKRIRDAALERGDMAQVIAARHEIGRLTGEIQRLRWRSAPVAEVRSAPVAEVNVQREARP